MLRFSACLLLCALLGACAEADYATLRSAQQEPVVNNARFSVDWAGTYQGMLPCGPGCDELATMLILYPDNRYTLRTRKVGMQIKDNIKEGYFAWSRSGSEIRLSSKEEHGVVRNLRVGHNHLLLLAPNGSILLDNHGQGMRLEKTSGVPHPKPTI